MKRQSRIQPRPHRTQKKHPVPGMAPQTFLNPSKMPSSYHCLLLQTTSSRTSALVRGLARAPGPRVTR